MMKAKLLRRSRRTLGCLVGVAFFLVTDLLSGQAPIQERSASELLRSKECFERESDWHGFSRFHFRIDGRKAYLVAPKRVKVGNPWVWRARFPDYHSDADQLLLDAGFHIAYVDVAGLFGSPRAVEIGNEFYAFVVGELRLAYKPALEAVSRGGLFAYNWALANPHRVACIYCDTPVLDFNSWPRGNGVGVGHPGVWEQCKREYGLSDEQASSYRQNPVDRAEEIANSLIPLLHIVSENDQVVPPAENSYRLKEKLEVLGGSLPLISVKEGTQKSQGHHFKHPDVNRIVKFIKRHASAEKHHHLLVKYSQRILFLGDSITYSGDYVAFFEMWLAQLERKEPSVVINAGLPSETVSGLSEKGHAGGRFPRPNLHDRLDEVLKVTQPDLVFACYGMNCGIYQPFNRERFSAFKQGLKRLKVKVAAAGAKLVLITPPTYDRHRDGPGFDYDDVLAKYAQWICTQVGAQVYVFDLHTAMSVELRRRKSADPTFTFQPDKVHPNQVGHWRIAAHLIDWLSDPSFKELNSFAEFSAQDKSNKSKALYPLYRKRMELSRDSYLTAAGHTRPGIKAGLPINEASAKRALIDKSIELINARSESATTGSEKSRNKQ